MNSYRKLTEISLQDYILGWQYFSMPEKGDLWFSVVTIMTSVAARSYLEKRDKPVIFKRHSCPVYGCATLNVLHRTGSQKLIRVSLVSSRVRDTDVLCGSVNSEPRRHALAKIQRWV